MMIADKAIKSKESGFSLLEILISIAFFLLLAVGGTAAFGPWTKFKRVYDTDERLSILKDAVKSMYSNSAWYLDDTNMFPVPYLNASREIQTGPAGLDDLCDPNESDGHEAAVTAALNGLLGYTGRDAKSTLVDGHNHPVCLFVSDRMGQFLDGSFINYRMISILSKGENGKQEAVWDRATGTFSVPACVESDDKYFIVSGWEIQQNNYTEVVRRMDRIVRAYQAYFSSRYKFDPSPSAAYKYFHMEGCPDGHNGSLPSGGAGGGCPYSKVPVFDTPTSISSDNAGMTDLMSEIGISQTDTVMPWSLSTTESNPVILAGAKNILLQNECPAGSNASTCMIRSPTIGSFPPFSVWVGGILPGGSVLSRIAIGAY